MLSLFQAWPILDWIPSARAWHKRQAWICVGLPLTVVGRWWWARVYILPVLEHVKFNSGFLVVSIFMFRCSLGTSCWQDFCSILCNGRHLPVSWPSLLACTRKVRLIRVQIGMSTPSFYIVRTGTIEVMFRFTFVYYSCRSYDRL